MWKWIVLILFGCRAFAQIGGGGAFFTGSPPGGIGGACSTTTYGYLTAAGQVVTCVASVWTVSAGSSGGTVTTLSVATANGFSGSVANPTTSPAITLSCATCAFTSNPLSQFAATTSAQLLGVLSNPTGTGLAVFGTSPTIVTPTIASFTNAAHNHANAAGGGQLSLTTAVTGLLPIVNGGTGTSTPALVAGTNVTITGSWPNQTVNSTGGSGSGCVPSGSVGQVLTDSGSGTCTSNSSLTISGGNVTASGAVAATSVSTGTSPPSSSVCAAGTAGGDCMLEGTTPTGTFSGVDLIWANATGHRLELINNASTSSPILTATSPDTLTNKTYDTAGTGNSFSINGVAATANTGTGSVVRATSPTLVTPALGTPSALVLTNATGLPVAGGGTGAATLTAHGPLIGEGTSAIAAASPGTTGQCYLSNGASTDPSFQACPGGAGAGNSVTSTTPVTVNTNTTSDQQLMELSLGAGYFNSSKQPFLFDGAGVYSTQAAQTPTITLKIKLCTVSGCGSGTVVTLISIVSTATVAAVTNNNWNLAILGYTATTGATGNLEIHGPLAVDLGALTTTADSIFVDTNTAVSSNIDLTAALFVDFTIAFSTNAATANTFTQRSGGVMPFAATAAPVTSVFTQTGAVGNLTGDVTTSGSVATTIAANAVSSSKMAVVNTRRVCDIPINDTSGSAITSGQMGPQSRVCFIPAAATIVEMDVNADAGTPNVIVGRNHAGTIVNIVSSALATAASGGIACSNTGGTTGLNGVTTCSSTLQNTSLSAGDYLELVSGTPGGTAKFFVVHVVYTVN